MLMMMLMMMMVVVVVVVVHVLVAEPFSATLPSGSAIGGGQLAVSQLDSVSHSVSDYYFYCC